MRAPTVTHVIPLESRVLAMASLGDDVFVTRPRHIDVYDATTFALQRRLKVPELGLESYGLAVCANNKCLYASDYSNSYIHRVELSASNAVMKWPVARGPTGLTVTSANNLLVVSRDDRKLQEFTTCGTLLRNIQLQAGIDHPRGVMEVSTGQFVLSYEGSSHSVCLMNVDVLEGGKSTANLLRVYGGRSDCLLYTSPSPRDS